jgi:hypothetical protein
VQVLAFVGAGCWALYQYLSHQREAQVLSNSQLALKNREAELGIELARMKQRQEAVATDFRTSARFLPRLTVDWSRGASADEYKGIARLTAENLSEIDVEVSLIILDAYVGSVDLNRASGPAVRFSNPPPSRWSSPTNQGLDITWQRLGVRASASPNTLSRGVENVQHVFKSLPPFTDSGGTGLLRRGESIPYTRTVRFYRVPRNGYLGIVASICFNRCVDVANDRWWLSEQTAVDDIATSSGSASR